MSDGSSAAGPARPKRLIRKFDADWRLRVTAESFAPGALVSEVARRHGVRSNLLSFWRQRYGAKARALVPISSAAAPAVSPTQFVPVQMATGAPPASRPVTPTSPWIEIDIHSGTLRLCGEVSAAQLREVLAAVR
jgi:transposase